MPGLRQQLCLGHRSCPSLHGLWCGRADRELSYFPFVYIPVAATLQPPRPGARGVRGARLGSGPWRVFFRVVLPQLRLAMTRRRAAGRAAPAGRVRRLRDDPLRHLHHRDHRSVPVHLQRRGRQHAGQRPGRLLPVLLVVEVRDPRQRPLRPASAPAARRVSGAVPLGAPDAARALVVLAGLIALACRGPAGVRALAGSRRRHRRSGCRTSCRPGRCCQTLALRRPAGPPCATMPAGVPVVVRCRARRAGSAVAGGCPTTSPAPCPASWSALAFVTVSDPDAVPRSTRRSFVLVAGLRAAVPAPRAGEPAVRACAGAADSRRPRGLGKPPLVAFWSVTARDGCA